MPEVAAPPVPETRSEKIKAGIAKARAGKDALKAGLLAQAETVRIPDPPVAEEFEPYVAPVQKVVPIVPGFLPWTDFCNKVAVEMVMNPVLYSKIGKYAKGDLDEVRAMIAAEPGPFYGIMRGAYMAMHAVHSIGAAEFGAAE